MPKIWIYFSFIVIIPSVFKNTQFLQITAMRKTPLILVFTLLFYAAVQAQTSAGWTRLQSDDGEFSVELPNNYSYFYDADGFIISTFAEGDLQYAQMQMLCGAAENTVMSVEIYKVSPAKKFLNVLVEKHRTTARQRDESQSGFTIKTFEQQEMKSLSGGKAFQISHITKFIASKNYIYVLTASNHGTKTAAFEHFLNSVKLNAAPSNQLANSETVKISSLKPITIAQIAETAAAGSSKSPISAQSQQPVSVKDDSAPFMILVKPNPSYTGAARNSSVTGKIRVRVTFENDGRISKIAFLDSLPGGLDRSAFFSAMRIKFIPGEKDGKPQTVSKVLEYSFSIY